MSIEMEWAGIKDLIKEAEKLASGVELEKVSNDIIKKQAARARGELKSKIKRSKDNSKSGRKGVPPGGHWADNIPISKIKGKNGYNYIIVGIEKSDNSPYFYAKFIEWGTSNVAPNPSFSVVKKEIGKELESIAINEYEKLIESKLGG